MNYCYLLLHGSMLFTLRDKCTKLIQYDCHVLSIYNYSDEMIERSSLSTLVSNSYKPIVVVVVIMTARGFATLPSQVASVTLTIGGHSMAWSDSVSATPQAN